MGPQARKVLMFKDLEGEVLAQQPEEGWTAGKPRQCAGRVQKVPSMLFDLELEDGCAEEPKQPDEDVQDVVRQLKSLLQPWSAVELELHEQVHRAGREAAADGLKLDAHQLAQRLRVPGHAFKVRAALGGGWSGDCLRQLRHFFLTCQVAGSAGAGGSAYVIDPCFREQFEVANPSARYAAVLAALPREFVGTEERVAAVVTLLAGEIKRSFQVAGATLPPWRQPSSMLSKWRPRRSLDTPIGSAGEQPPLAQRRAASPGRPPPKELPPTSKADIVASCSGCAPTAAALLASQPISCPRPVDWPTAGGGKRGRDRREAGAKCPSLLAAKLRGVACASRGAAFAGLRPEGSQA